MVARQFDDSAGRPEASSSDEGLDTRAGQSLTRCGLGGKRCLRHHAVDRGKLNQPAGLAHARAQGPPLLISGIVCSCGEDVAGGLLAEVEHERVHRFPTRPAAERVNGGHPVTRLDRQFRCEVHMQVDQTAIAGVVRFQPQPHLDERGFFVRTFDADTVRGAGIDPTCFVQDSQSRSRRGTLRGLHLRTDGREAKLVRCSRGAIFDVVVDVREGSPSYGSWLAFTLDDLEHAVLHIPPGCAHGFQVLTEDADVCYRMDAPYASGHDATVSYADPALGIPWPLAVTALSQRDSAAPLLAQVSPVRMAS